MLGLVLVAALWWTFFNSDPERAEKALGKAPVNQHVRLSLHGFFFSFILILFGIVMLSAGLGHAVTDITHALPVKYAVLLGGGTSVYFLGLFAFRQAFGIQPATARLVAVAAAMTSCWVGYTATALAHVSMLMAIVISVVVVEGTNRKTSSC